MLFSVSCKKDTNSKELIADNLMSPFIAECDFIFSKGESTIDGKMRLSKDDTLRIDILSPDSLSGISVESDSKGQISNFIVSFSGIKSEVPKEVLEKLSLTFNLFAPNIPSLIKKLPDSSFIILDSSDSFSIQGLTNISPASAGFKDNQVNYGLIYDSNTGTPLSFAASFSDSSVTLNFTKFKGLSEKSS